MWASLVPFISENVMTSPSLPTPTASTATPGQVVTPVQVDPPSTKPFWLQPAFLVGILGPIAAFISAKFGVPIDPVQLATIVGGIGALALAMAHHQGQVDAANATAHGVIVAAHVDAAAQVNAASAAANLSKQ